MTATPKNLATLYQAGRGSAQTMNPQALRAAESKCRPSRKARANAQDANLRYKAAADQIKASDPEAYKVVTDRIESYKTIASKWQERATHAESRLAALESHLNDRRVEEKG